MGVVGHVMIRMVILKDVVFGVETNDVKILNLIMTVTISPRELHNNV